MHAEFEVLGVPFEERGCDSRSKSSSTELACGVGVSAFDGPNHSIPETGVHFVPVERPNLWVCGDS
jgi:hypothetical protein